MKKKKTKTIEENKSQTSQHCIRDFSTDVFELTPEMLVEERSFNIKEQSKFAGIAECILRKYDKVLAKV